MVSGEYFFFYLIFFLRYNLLWIFLFGTSPADFFMDVFLIMLQRNFTRNLKMSKTSKF